MDSKTKYGCALCGNPVRQPGEACDICGANDSKFIIINLGYLYPSEARLIRIFLVIFILIVLIAVFTATYIITQISISI